MKLTSLLLTAVLCTACGPSLKDRAEQTRDIERSKYAGMVMDVENATADLEIIRLNADTAKLTGKPVDKKAIEDAEKKLAASKLALQLDGYLAEVRN